MISVEFMTLVAVAVAVEFITVEAVAFTVIEMDALVS